MGRRLWGRGPMPTRYKVLFVGQAVMFTFAMWIRTLDVERAQAIKQMQQESGKVDNAFTKANDESDKR